MHIGYHIENLGVRAWASAKYRRYYTVCKVRISQGVAARRGNYKEPWASIQRYLGASISRRE
jgi:hypothetical protein